MDKLLEIVKNMTPQQLMLVVGGGVTLLIVILLSVALLSQQRLTLLYGNLSPEDSAEIIKFLEQTGEAYEISDSNSILVVPEKVARLRISLAERNLPNSGSIAGYELFDQDQGFGTSNFVQQLNHLRALEGELAKTITSIDGIRTTRVHLVLPKRELFNRNQREPRASVVLTLTRTSQTLPKSQIAAIRSLIASAVPALAIANISVIDSKGRLLARGSTGEEGDAYIGGSSADEIRAAYESRLSTDLQELVENVVGFGNARVEVSAEMDFSQTLIQEEIFDPEGQVLVSSEELTENNENTNNVPDGQVTVTNNLPGAEANANGQDSSRSVSSRNQVVNNYQNSRRSVSRTIQPGQVDRLSVAVLVDGTYTSDNSDNQIYTPRSDQEIAAIERLVRSAIGFDGTVRQDHVEVVNLRFATEDDVDGFIIEDKILGIQVSQIENLVELIVLSIVALVVFLLVLRPLLIRALGGTPGRRDIRILADGTMVDRKTGEPVGPAPDIQAGVVAGVEGGTTTAASLLGGAGAGELVDLTNVDAQIQQGLSKQLNEVASRFPDETGNVVKHWLLEG